MTLARLVAKNTVRNKPRTLLTVLSITGSLLLLTFLASIYKVFYLDHATQQSALRLITRHRVSMAFFLPSYYADRIRRVPGVVAVAPMSWIGNRYKDDRPENMFAQWATDSGTIFNVYTEDHIDPEQLLAWQKDRNGAVTTRHLAAKYGWKLGDRIFLARNLWPMDLDVTLRAIYDAPEIGDCVSVHRELVWEALPVVKGKDDMFAIRVDSPESLPRVAAAIDAMFKNSPQPTRTETEKAFEVDFLQSLGNVKLFIMSIASAVVFTILLVAGNTMAMSVRERIREVALLKTLGFSRGSVLAVFVAEGVMLSLIGGILGVAAAAWLIIVIGKAPQFALFSSFFASARVSAPTALFAMSIALTVGLISSLLPSYRASRLDIVEALRHVG